jgi:hypothetical protein
MSDSVKKRIQDAFERARCHSAGLNPAPKVTSYAEVVEVVQPIAEPVIVDRRMIEYSSNDIYDIPESKPEKLDTLFSRAEKYVDEIKWVG